MVVVLWLCRENIIEQIANIKVCFKLDLNDDPRPGRPEASNRAELVEKVREKIVIDANFTENAGRRIKFILLYNLYNIN